MEHFDTYSPLKEPKPLVGLFNLKDVLTNQELLNCTRFQTLLIMSHLNIFLCSFVPLLIPLSPPARHRCINLFLHGYQRFWIETEENSFEETLIQDLAVSTGLAEVWLRAQINN